MEARAVVRYARMSPQKARLVANMVRGKKVSHAVNILKFTNKLPAAVISKLLKSAVSNAENKNVADPDEMKIERIFVDAGPVIKRYLSRARGRVDVLRKPFSHVTVVLKETEKPKKKKAVAKKKEKEQGKVKGQEEKAAPKKAKAGKKEVKAVKAKSTKDAEKADESKKKTKTGKKLKSKKGEK